MKKLLLTILLFLVLTNTIFGAHSVNGKYGYISYLSQNATTYTELSIWIPTGRDANGVSQFNVKKVKADNLAPEEIHNALIDEGVINKDSIFVDFSIENNEGTVRYIGVNSNLNNEDNYLDNSTGKQVSNIKGMINHDDILKAIIYSFRDSYNLKICFFGPGDASNGNGPRWNPDVEKSMAKASGIKIDISKVTKADAPGKKSTNGWQGDYYYENGNVVKNAWKQYGSDWYYCGSTGAIEKNKWIGEFYVDSTGKMLKNTTTPDGLQVDADGKKITTTTTTKEIVGTNNNSTTMSGYYKLNEDTKIRYPGQMFMSVKKDDVLEVLRVEGDNAIVKMKEMMMKAHCQ